MHRSAVAAVVLASAALLLVCGCSGKTPLQKQADLAMKTYFDRPDEFLYASFMKANGAAAKEHGITDDALGVEYQLRILEVQASEAERADDAWMSEQVTSTIDHWRDNGADDHLEEALPGAKQRLAAARERAARVK
jgi:hypothetical protein